MTPLTENETNVRVFASVVGRAQEVQYSSEAFKAIVTTAQEGIHTVGTLSAMVYGDSGGKATSTRNKFKVKPNIVDFLVDVQNVARKTLTPGEYKYFHHIYFVQYTPVDDVTVYGPIDQTIRRKLGDAFIRFELHPFSTYMNHDDLDVRKRQEGTY